MSNTFKQQFTANQSIYQLSDKDRSVPDVMVCDVVFGLVKIFSPLRPDPKILQESKDGLCSFINEKSPSRKILKNYVVRLRLLDSWAGQGLSEPTLFGNLHFFYVIPIFPILF